MTALLELAERVELAAGPDDDLDREIWLTVVADDNQRELVRVGRSLHGDVEAEFRISRMMDGLHYTASLDAAMTLVPEEWEVLIASTNHATVRKSGGGKACRVEGCATAALALCAAALRAADAKGVAA